MPRPLNLAAARERAHLNAAKLARALGMIPASYRRIERGERKCSAELLAQIADFLGVSVGALYEGEENEVVSGTATVAERKVDLPVWGVATLNGFEVEMVATAMSIERPSSVADLATAYALHVHNDDAAPRANKGETLIVNPVLPISEGQWVVVCIKKGDRVLAEIWKYGGTSPSGKTVVLVRNLTTRSAKMKDIERIDKIVEFRVP